MQLLYKDGSPFSSGMVGHPSTRAEGAETVNRVLRAMSMTEAFLKTTSVLCYCFKCGVYKGLGILSRKGSLFTTQYLSYGQHGLIGHYTAPDLYGGKG